MGILKNLCVGTIILAYDILEKKQPSEYLRNILSSYGSVLNGISGPLKVKRIEIIRDSLVLAGSSDSLYTTLDDKVNTGG